MGPLVAERIRVLLIHLVRDQTSLGHRGEAALREREELPTDSSRKEGQPESRVKRYC